MKDTRRNISSIVSNRVLVLLTPTLLASLMAADGLVWSGGFVWSDALIEPASINVWVDQE